MAAALVVLGAGSILPSVERGCAGYALLSGAGEDGDGDAVTLLDCGPGTVRALGAAGIALARVRRVVFSHYHPDHCLDLYALAFARRNPGAGDAPQLELVGPPGLARLAHETPPAFGSWVRDPNATLRELVLDGTGRAAFETPDGLRFACTRNGHSDALVALSWRVERADAWSLLYTGDTNEDERVVALARGVDVMVAECSFPERDATDNHLTPGSAARMARAAGAGRLVLSHFYPSNDPVQAAELAREVFGGPVEVARDGSVHPLAR